MANSYFQFKQFTVFHDKCAMKVGTDGVLLGAWTRVEGMSDVLDVGTGTGLIALMITQRNPQARVVAIDVDEDAAGQARMNIANSPFSDRITVEHMEFRQFVQLHSRRFDLVVSNPPYFSDSLLPADVARAKAKHSVSLSLHDLLFAARGCLKDYGTLSLILPYDRREELHGLCVEHLFYVKRETVVYPLPSREPKRLLVELTMRQTGQPEINSLVIETDRHHYTEDFSSLVRDFYLHI